MKLDTTENRLDCSNERFQGPARCDFRGLDKECDFVANFRGNFDTFGELELESLLYRWFDGSQDLDCFAQDQFQHDFVLTDTNRRITFNGGPPTGSQTHLGVRLHTDRNGTSERPIRSEKSPKNAVSEM